MTLTTQILVEIDAKLRSQLDLVNPAADLHKQKTINLADGDGLNQSDRIFSDKRTLDAGTNEELDLSNLTDALGNAVVLGHVKGLYVAPEGGLCHVGGATSGLTAWGDASDFSIVRDGGAMLLTAPDATGYAVTSGVDDKLKVANPGAAAITYEVIIIGAA